MCGWSIDSSKPRAFRRQRLHHKHAPPRTIVGAPGEVIFEAKRQVRGAVKVGEGPGVGMPAQDHAALLLYVASEHPSRTDDSTG